MLGVGWHYLPGGPQDLLPPLPTATTLDSDVAQATRSPYVLIRPYFTGRPHPQEVANRLAQEPCRSRRNQLGNEPNLPHEQFGGGPADYAEWFMDVATLVTDSTTSLYYAGMSPGVPGWQDWYTNPVAQEAIALADGLAIHAYGSFEQMRDVTRYIATLYPNKPLWVAECNFGAGQAVDINVWANQHLRPYLDDCATIPNMEAVNYFAYVWATPDMSLPTPVDGRGTQVENILHEWEVPFMPTGDVTLSVPTQTRLAHPKNYSLAPIGPVVGVVIHSTGGRNENTLQQEYDATVSWFQNPSAEVSAHRVVGPTMVNTSVHDMDTAWHARSDNSRRRGIEVAHPDTATYDHTDYLEFQYAATAELIAKWKLSDESYGHAWPIQLLTRQQLAAHPDTPGIAYHRDTPNGVSDGKVDPTGPFDGNRLVAEAQAWYNKITGAQPTPQPPTQDPGALRDQTYSLAEQLQALGPKWQEAGYPQHAEYVRTQGEAIKRTMVIGKGEK